MSLSHRQERYPRKDARTNQHMLDWLKEREAGDLLLGALTIGELRRGAARFSRQDPISADALSSWVNAF